MSEQWLDELKKDDRVIVRTNVGFQDDVPFFGKVLNITPKTRVIKVVLDNGKDEYFFNFNGIERRTGYHKAHLEQLTHEKEVQILKERGRLSIISRMQKYDWSKLTYEQAMKASEFMKSIRKEE